jgi:hypothetical protein
LAQPGGDVDMGITNHIADRREFGIFLARAGDHSTAGWAHHLEGLPSPRTTLARRYRAPLIHLLDRDLEVALERVRKCR